MNKYKIEIVNDIENEKYFQLEELIKEFAIDVYVVQRLKLYNSNYKKIDIVKNYKKELSNEDIKILEEDISSRIEFAKDSIKNNNKEKVTRYYILLENEKVISFQTAQVRKNENIFEGWRNFAYIKPEYAGKSGIVINTHNKIQNGILSNIIYEDITGWFKEIGVTIERTATGKNMHKNILTYIVVKGFIPEIEDDQRVYLVKKYLELKPKDELKNIYKEYIPKNNKL